VCRLCELCPFDGVQRLFGKPEDGDPSWGASPGVVIKFPGSLTTGGGPLVVLIIVMFSRVAKLVQPELFSLKIDRSVAPIRCSILSSADYS